MRPITSDNAIRLFLHCALCSAEPHPGLSATDYSDIEVGWTEQGIQAWCKRHKCNIVHIDFEGAKHPANTTRNREES